MFSPPDCAVTLQDMGMGVRERKSIFTVIASVSEAIHSRKGRLDCFVASLLAMTDRVTANDPQPSIFSFSAACGAK